MKKECVKCGNKKESNLFYKNRSDKVNLCKTCKNEFEQTKKGDEKICIYCGLIGNKKLFHKEGNCCKKCHNIANEESRLNIKINNSKSQKLCVICKNLKPEGVFKHGWEICNCCRENFENNKKLNEKICLKCGTIGDKNIFREKRNVCCNCHEKFIDNYLHINKLKITKKRKAYHKKYKKKNAEKLKVKRHNYYIKNKKKVNDKNKRNWHKNKAKYKLTKKKYKQKNKKKINAQYKLRLIKNPLIKLHKNTSRAIHSHLKSLNIIKDGETFSKYLSYSDKELCAYLKLLFEDWMTEHNQGNYDPLTWKDNNPSTFKWQVDHIKPISHFKNIKDENSPEFKECWSLKNLRPLSAKQNQLEGNKRTNKQIRQIYKEIEEKLKNKK